jgi:hypothetical protein
VADVTDGTFEPLLDDRLLQAFPKLGITSRSALRDALDSLRRTGTVGTMT